MTDPQLGEFAGNPGAEPPADPPDPPDPPEETPEPEGDPSDPDAGFYRVIRLKDKDDEEEFFNRQYDKRYRRVREKIRGEIEDDLREEIDAEYADDKEEARKKLAARRSRLERQEGRVSELQDTVEEMEQQLGDLEAERDRYKRVVDAQWRAIKDRIQPHVRELIEDRDVLWRLSYANKHPEIYVNNGSNGEPEPEPEAVAAASAGPGTTVFGSPPTPPNATNRRRQTTEEDREAQQDFMRNTHSAL